MKPQPCEPFRWPEGQLVTRPDIEFLDACEMTKKILRSAEAAGWMIVLAVDEARPGHTTICMRPIQKTDAWLASKEACG